MFNRNTKPIGLVGAGLLAVGVACAAPAVADPIAEDFVATNGWRVCVDLDALPNFNGIKAIQVELARRGYNQEQRGEIILLSVTDQCRRHIPLLKAYVDSKTPQLGRAA
ncbi:hypothetical protein [Mycobacteroides chelonae]|uniref:hypothetical protein n=1 Tax=Mycobacteroides chelonae TaxID=1774 RepID=UPI0009BF1129|nr:hypothetical protein [Mycobacteroides chelonae]